MLPLLLYYHVIIITFIQKEGGKNVGASNTKIQEKNKAQAGESIVSLKIIFQHF